MSTPPNTSLTVGSFGTTGGGTADGSPPHGVTVTLGATLDYNGTPIPVNTGDVTKLKNNFQFTLSTPVDLGSIHDFLGWLHTSLGLPDLSDDVQNLINTLKSSTIGIAKQLGILLDDIYNATITISVLVINRTPTTTLVQLGVTMTLLQPFEIIKGLNLDGLGVLVGYSG
jgi:hypothetical protein